MKFFRNNEIFVRWLRTDVGGRQ